MDKAPDAFRTISEVAEQLDVPQHVLRFWESRFGRRFVIGPEKVASAILDAVERGKHELVVPRFPYGLAPLAQALLPSLTGKVLSLDSYRPDD